MTFEPEHATSILLYFGALILALAAAVFLFYRYGKKPFAYPAGLLIYALVAVLLAVKLAPEAFEIVNLAAYGVFIGGPLILALAAVLARKNKLTVTANFYIGLALLVVAVGVDAFFIEPHMLETTYVTVTTKKLAKPVKIAVISDIQVDRVTDYERGVLKKVMDEKPDLILLPGDYVQCLTREKEDATIEQFRDLLRQSKLSAPMGAYAVKGNAEWPDWVKTFKDLPLKAMDETTTFDDGPLTITALSFSDSFNPKVKLGAQKNFYIVFGHGPDFALASPPADLLVAGHTHGGQVRLPFLGPIITLCRVPRSWAAGTTQISPTTTLVVSRGIGMERRYAPRLRFLCRPQLVFITVAPIAAK